MLTKKTGAGERYTMLLACDPSVAQAQETAALERLREADAAGGQAEAMREFARLCGSDVEAHERLTPGAADVDHMEPAVLAYMASVAAARALDRYRASCDVNDLLAIPDDATKVVVRIPSSREVAQADASCGPCPETGRLRYAQAAQAARAADNAHGAWRGYREALAAARAAVVAEVDAASADPLTALLEAAGAVTEAAKATPTREGNDAVAKAVGILSSIVDKMTADSDADEGSDGEDVADALLDAAKAAKGAGGKMITALAEAIKAWSPQDGWASAHARYLDSLTAAERREVNRYLVWQGDQHAARFAAFVESVDGLDLTRDPRAGYPVQALLDSVREGAAVVSEVAQAVWTLSTLGKPERLPSPSPSGSRTNEGEAAGGSAPTAPTTTCGSAADDAAAPSETTSTAAAGERG